MENAPQKQPYDNLLKRLVQNQPNAILPMLFPDLVKEVIGPLNIEILIPPRRTDRVYKILPVDGDEEEIFHIEYEASPNNNMDKRLLVYHSVLYEEHGLPITSVIVYPFEFAGVEPPLIEWRQGKKVLQFDYKIVRLWKEDARIYVEQKLVPLYGLLPTMDGTSDDLLLQAIDEMVQYYQNDEELLRDELLCFRTMLNRAKRLPAPEFKKVDRRLRMFDPLLEEDPWVKEKLAEREAKGEANQAREMVVRFVQRRFSSLTDLAREKMAHANQIEAVNALMEQLWFAADEYAARALLENFTEKRA